MKKITIIWLFLTGFIVVSLVFPTTSHIELPHDKIMHFEHGILTLHYPGDKLMFFPSINRLEYVAWASWKTTKLSYKIGKRPYLNITYNISDIPENATIEKLEMSISFLK